MFLAIEEAIGDLFQLKLLNTETGEYACILPDFGGNVNQLVLANSDKKLISVIDGYISAADALENAGYKSSKLLPFPNRLRDGKYTFKRTTHQLGISRPQEGHAIHGLWHSAKYEVIKSKSTDQKATVHLLYTYKGEMAGYPFRCEILLKYKLSNKGFQCTTEIRNTGKTALPFGDGWHPYFYLNTQTIDTLQLTMPPVRYMPLDDRKIPSGNTVSYLDFFQTATIGNTQLDHGFEVLQAAGKAITTLSDAASNTHLEIWQQCDPDSYNYLQIYTPADRKTIAIEPMTCAADAFNNGLGLWTLAPKASKKAKYGVRMK
jgi:aldose 1-epimerase